MEAVNWFFAHSNSWYSVVATITLIASGYYIIHKRYIHPLMVLVRSQLEPNGGGSLTDKVTQLHTWKTTVDAKLDVLAEELDAARCRAEKDHKHEDPF